MIFHDTTGLCQPIKYFLEDINLPLEGLHKLHLAFGNRWHPELNKPGKKQKTWSIYAEIILEVDYPLVIRQVIWIKKSKLEGFESETDEEIANDEIDNMVYIVGYGLYVYLRKTKQLKGHKGRMSRCDRRKFAYQLLRRFKQWREINGY